MRERGAILLFWRGHHTRLEMTRHETRHQTRLEQIINLNRILHDELFSTLILNTCIPTTNLHWARVVGCGPFSSCVFHKEGLCPSSEIINRLMMMMMISQYCCISEMVAK
jgi:hypothetical protein